MSSTYRVPARIRWMRVILRAGMRAIFRTFGRVEIQGLENVPKQGAYLLIFNHVSYYDPPLLMSFWPTAPEALGADYLWDTPGMGLLARLYGAIPLRRGDVDRDALEKAMSALRSGLPLLISPEGTRAHFPGMQSAKAGVVYILERTGVPIIPVGVTGTDDTLISRAFHGSRPRILIHIGRQFDLPEIVDGSKSPREIRQMKADALMQRLAELLPDEYQGVYRQSKAD
jgi:1-acyl-sn-glycerol-3-phosphate acyltransferase